MLAVVSQLYLGRCPSCALLLMQKRGPEMRWTWLAGRCWERLTVELLEHPVDGAGAAGAAHADVELVGVCVGHCEMC